MPDSSSEIAVVVRYTQYDGVGPAERVSLMRAFQEPLEADAEADRLNGARPDDRVEYFVKILQIAR